MDETNQAQAVNDLGEECDWILQTFVELANHGVEIPITLTVGAGLVSGVIIGGTKYLDGLRHSLTGGSDQDWNGLVSDVVEKWKLKYERKDDDEPVKLEDVRYIHLRDAKLLVGNEFVPVAGVFWRAQLQAVTGFTIGTLGLAS